MLAWWAAAGVAAVAAVFVRGHGQRVLLLLTVGSLAGGWFVLRTETIRWDSIERVAVGDGRTLLAVEGLVLSKPEPRREAIDRLSQYRFEQAGASFDLRVEKAQLGDGIRRASGSVRVYVDELAEGSLAHIEPGAKVRLVGWYLPPVVSMNPGDSDRLRWARLSGRAGSVSTSSGALVERIDEDATGWRAGAVRTTSALRARASSLLDGEPTAGRAILRAILLGEDDPSLRESRSAFAATGTSHLLAISGFHLAVLCAIAAMGLRLSGEHGGLESLVLAALVVLVLVLVPARVPIVRAGVMVLVLLVSDAMGRRYDRLTILGWVAVGLFLWRPMDVFSMGAQLSVGITALLLWPGLAKHRWLVEPQILGVRKGRGSVVSRLNRNVRGYFGVCVVCWLFSLPIVMCHTGQVNLTGALTTAFMTPLIVVLLGVGYIALFVHLIWPGSAAMLVLLMVEAADWGGGLIERVAAVEALSPVVTPSSAIWACVAMVTLWAYLRAARVWNWPLIAAMGLLVASVALFQTGNRPLRPGVLLRIDTLAVGDGSCFIVRSGREAMLWDCGSLRADLRPVLERAQRALGVRAVSAAVVTHADLDHYISLPDAMEVFGIGRVLVPEHFLLAKNAPLRSLHEELSSRNVEPETIARGDYDVLGHTAITVLWPPASAEMAKDNEVSVVCRLEVQTDVGVRRVLLTGDIESGAMEVLLEHREWIAADVLEVPHHGSFSLKAWEFVEAVGPRVVLQSTGIRRARDERWNGAKRAREWYVTALDGASWVEIMHDGTIRSGSMRRTVAAGQP